ncbi:RimJ/RimL family protein N-acetyltransferase [Peptoniphilus olsenii]|uniref:RimJ/RimL family protein N-acetyltransferase n=1 Tax=Peptoniphilus olsenii TaxID=411570 RepID=A0ABV2J6I2_9FIRM
MLKITTENLIIRNVMIDDVSSIYKYRNNKICYRYQRGQAKSKKEITQLVLNNLDKNINLETNTLLAIAIKETNEIIGEILIMPKDMTISLGYTISPEFQNKGYGFESVSKLIDILHSKFPKHEFICFCHPDNTFSIKLLEKLGFTNMGYYKVVESLMFGKWINIY